MNKKGCDTMVNCDTFIKTALYMAVNINSDNSISYKDIEKYLQRQYGIDDFDRVIDQMKDSMRVQGIPKN